MCLFPFYFHLIKTSVPMGMFVSYKSLFGNIVSSIQFPHGIIFVLLRINSLSKVLLT